jgi:D-alanyl-D-alanine carboxypeptidase/D-alanyl-D-alanine-endopeptidase (penicillin-binding protein 4)
MSPEARALEWFGDSLRRENPSLVVVTDGPGQAPPDGQVLATVSSAPIVDLIDIMVSDSDNSLAEVIGREVALALDLVDIGEAVSMGAGVTSDLLDQVDLQGASGLSSATTASHRAVTELLSEINKDNEFRPIRDSLPVGAETGSLRNRFTSVSPELAGRVEAKTGSIRGTRSLAGYVRADDGAELVFSLNVTGNQVDNSSRDDIDLLLAEVSRCGANLAHWEPQDRE